MLVLLLSGCAATPPERCLVSPKAKLATQATFTGAAGAGTIMWCAELFEWSSLTGALTGALVSPVLIAGIGIGTWFAIDSIIDDCE